jgi:myo-inositol-1-phosphate synthase
MIKVAIAGVGNCASALVQALSASRKGALEGLIRERIGRWGVEDIEVVAAFDVDRRKVGRTLGEAVVAKPNCVQTIEAELSDQTTRVVMGPVLDGIAPHMADYEDDEAFRPASEEPVNVTQVLRESGAEILVCYLPVGATEAVEHYAYACLEAHVALVNCVPVFIASDERWAGRFVAAGLPIVGDDIKAQVGATITHRTLARLFADRGVRIDRTYQLNTGGNTDFLNMLARERLTSKKKSKTQSVQSVLNEPIPARDVHIGPSDYVPWQKDNKIAFVRIEGRGLGGSPIELEMRLSVQDSPNSAGVVLDAIRCAKLALDAKVSGPLYEPSSAFMKSPPRQVGDFEAQAMCDDFIAKHAGPVRARRAR